MKSVSTDDRQLCTFFVAGRTFGVEVSAMREVLKAQPLTRVPLAPRQVRGLINLRGQIVTAIDLRERLGFPPFTGERASMNVIVEGEDGLVSLLVDEIGDVVVVSGDDVESLPDTVGEGVRRLIRCVYKLQDKLLLLLDIEKTVAEAG
jgi:purine-binding chemotaxis protein CheW